jgi:hypothetical protein
MELITVFILLIALLVTALLFSRQTKKPDFSESDTPIGDQLAYEMGIKTWDV